MKKILIIEDENALREGILQTVGFLGFEGIPAENGAVGVQLAKMYLPDLIISDIMMPELDGYGVYAAIRQDPETASIPFIFLSAKADKPDIRQGMNLGADDYLTKPFTTEELQSAIAARLNKQDAITQPYIAEMKRAAENLSQLAYRDPLTGLPNRILLHQKLQDALTQAKRQQGAIAVLCLDLHRFKVVNSSLGYSAGDTLLQAVAERLKECVSPRDTIARLSGDQFSIILVETSGQPAVIQQAQVFLSIVTAPYSINGQSISIDVSIGIASYPEDQGNSDQLLAHAEMAMRRAKQQGRNNYEFYSTQIDALTAERQLLENHLRRAIENQEFQVYYQPQVNLITGRIVGAEALLRWPHPEFGMVSPAQFIPIAEETGLIIAIGEQVLSTVCAQVQAWQSNSLFQIRVAVNLSARQFRQHNLIEQVAQALSQTGLSPNCLGFELTETSVMENVESTIATLHELKAMGLHISIDDFGTGYSSLNYLKRFPLDTLKIDQSFVSEVTSDPNNAAIATAIIAMAQSLKLKVIAEGVETKEQFEFLRQHGCHAMQGYLFSPAVPAEEFEKLLKEDKRLSV